MCCKVVCFVASSESCFALAQGDRRELSVGLQRFLFFNQQVFTLTMSTNHPDTPASADSEECKVQDPQSGVPQEGASSTEAVCAGVLPEPSRDAIVDALKTVEDPELFLDIWFLGLIYDIRIDGGAVIIDMTFTSPMCPAGPQLKHEVLTKVGLVAGVQTVAVNITFQPPWEPSEEVKGMLGML